MPNHNPRIKRELTRRGFIGGVFGSALVIACGGGGSSSTTSVQSSPASTGSASATNLRLMPLKPSELGAPPVPPARAANVSTAVPYEPTVAVYEKFGTDASPGAFPRTIRHAMGSTTIQRAPQRVVVLDTGERDAVIDLGLKPVGAIESSGTPAYLGDALKDTKVVGTIAEPNLEAVAALAPDLILSNKLRHEALYGKISAIAPTVFGERAGLVWRHNYALYTQALGREQQGAGTIAAYEDRLKKLNAKLPSPRPTVSTIRVLDSNLRYYQRANFIGIVLNDMGFPRPDAQNVDDFGLINLGLESLGQYGNADLIVLSIVGGSGNAFARQLQESAIFKSLPGVQKGAVMTVDDQVWMGGLGYRAASVVMDDIEKYFKL